MPLIVRNTGRKLLSSWREFSHCNVPVVKARVEDIVRRCTGPKVLEVGCNEGWVAKAINEERGFEVTAVDNRDEAILQCKDYFNIDAIKADVYALPFPDGTFDTVVGGEILEHLEDPGKGLSELFRVSKGHVIITLPMGAYWLGEETHAFELNGAVVEHDHGIVTPVEKHVFVIEFHRRRKIVDGKYINI